ncbi:MAG: GNAT family N-acetyltransferase [Rhizobiaceae bacterium]
MPQSVEAFDPARHGREAFNSGVASVDNFLKLTARKQSEANIVTLFVVADEANLIIGFYALAAMSIDASELGATKNAKLFQKFRAVPASFIVMMGVDQNWQGQGIGKALLADALRRCHAASKLVASHCVVLEVLNDRIQENIDKRMALYTSLGFRPCHTETAMRVFLTMVDIEANLAG